jgi:hypothetical protein
MSSTNRGSQRSPADNYPTPAWCVRRFAERFRLPGSRWLEPCAGDGAIVKAFNQGAGLGPAQRGNWTMVEIRDECAHDLASLGPFYITDFLGWAPPRDYDDVFDVAITNPPFSLALPILQKCLTLAKVTILLLRLNWLGSEERHSFLTANPPDIYILPNRPPFTKNAKGKWATDSIEYAWFVWDLHKYIDHEREICGGHYELLSLTPLLERKRDRQERKR